MPEPRTASVQKWTAMTPGTQYMWLASMSAVLTPYHSFLSRSITDRTPPVLTTHLIPLLDHILPVTLASPRLALAEIAATTTMALMTSVGRQVVEGVAPSSRMEAATGRVEMGTKDWPKLYQVIAARIQDPSTNERLLTALGQVWLTWLQSYQNLQPDDPVAASWLVSYALPSMLPRWITIALAPTRDLTLLDVAHGVLRSIWWASQPRDWPVLAPHLASLVRSITGRLSTLLSTPPGTSTGGSSGESTRIPTPRLTEYETEWMRAGLQTIRDAWVSSWTWKHEQLRAVFFTLVPIACQLALQPSSPFQLDGLALTSIWLKQTSNVPAVLIDSRGTGRDDRRWPARSSR